MCVGVCGAVGRDEYREDEDRDGKKKSESGVSPSLLLSLQDFCSTETFDCRKKGKFNIFSLFPSLCNV